MSVLRRYKHGEYGEISPSNPLPTVLYDEDGKPLQTTLGELVVTSRALSTGLVAVPGVGAAVAYTSGDAFGTRFSFDVRVEGTVQTAIFLDRDDEGLNKELVLFSREFTQTADNAAFDVSDGDLLYCIGVVSITSWYNFNSNQIGTASPGLYYVAPAGKLWCQIVTRGADNIAAGSEPLVFLVVT